MLTYALVDLRGITLYPAKDSRVIYVEAALAHHLFDIPIRKLVSAIPSDAQKNCGRLEVTLFERGLILLQEYYSGRMLDELTSGFIAGEALPATLTIVPAAAKRQATASAGTWRPVG
jgi:hypothetical protein